MSIPGQILFGVYWAFMGILTIFALLQLFHALRFGQRIYRTVLTSTIFVGVGLFILWTAFAGLRGTSWTEPANIGVPAISLTP